MFRGQRPLNTIILGMVLFTMVLYSDNVLKSVFRNEELKKCLSGCDQDDPRLVELIQKEFIVPPSNLPYNFSTNPPKMDGQIGQVELIDKILDQKTNGFFVESGAFDGEAHSNTIYFEMKRNWTGILVEPGPNFFQTLISKRRKAYAINSCFSMDRQSSRNTFIEAIALSGLEEAPTDESMRERRRKVNHDQPAKKFEVQCFPFASVMSALNQHVIDYFSLDVEGAELKILKTIPFDQFRIRTITIEYNTNVQYGKEILTFMKSKGYKMVKVLAKQDLVFVRNDEN